MYPLPLHLIPPDLAIYKRASFHWIRRGDDNANSFGIHKLIYCLFIDLLIFLTSMCPQQGVEMQEILE